MVITALFTRCYPNLGTVQGLSAFSMGWVISGCAPQCSHYVTTAGCINSKYSDSYSRLVGVKSIDHA